MGQNPHIGGEFDDVLREEGTFTEVDAKARETVAAWQAAKIDLTWNQEAFDETHEEFGCARGELERVVRHHLSHPDIRPLFDTGRRMWFAYCRRAGLVNDTDRASLEARLGRALESEATGDRYFERRLANATVALSGNELEYADLLLKMMGY